MSQRPGVRSVVLGLVRRIDFLLANEPNTIYSPLLVIALVGGLVDGSGNSDLFRLHDATLGG
jgi:uncharacterized membrane-anchored protein YitT (DUF2179 family)